MNFGEAVANVAKKLGNRTDLNTSIQAEIQLAQAELEASRTLPWFLLQEELYTTVAADATSVGVPSDFLREYEGGALWIEDASTGKFTRLTKVHFDDLRSVEYDEEDTNPTYYALAGGNFYLAPPPAADTRLRIMCYRRAETLSDDADTNVWLDNNPELLIAKAGMRMAQYLRSTELFAMFQSQYSENMSSQEQANVAREMENFEASMGGS